MSKRQDAAPRTEMQATVRKVSIGARVLDAVLAVVFAWVAYTSETTLWQVLFGVSSAFCVFTAATGPLDKLPGIIAKRLSVTRKG